MDLFVKVMLVARFPEFDRCSGDPVVLFHNPRCASLSVDAKVVSKPEDASFSAYSNN